MFHFLYVPRLVLRITNCHLVLESLVYFKFAYVLGVSLYSYIHTHTHQSRLRNMKTNDQINAAELASHLLKLNPVEKGWEEEADTDLLFNFSPSQ